jgi:hypothetical protein
MYFVRLWIIGFSFAAALAFGLSGCSVHPLPENISRANTFDIVERIRCEVREGLQKYLVEARDPLHAQNIIAASTIGYDFTFEITEHNNKGAEDGKLFFKRPSFKNADKGFSLDLTAKAEKIRKNTRKFRIVESLGELTNGSNGSKCDKAYHANWVYPITGSTGMGEVVRTYIKLEELTDFPREDEDQLDERPFGGKVKGKNVVFSDKLEFTTTVRAGVKPVLELNAVAGKFKLTTASFMDNAEREDKHFVTVALASDLKEADDHGKIADGRKPATSPAAKKAKGALSKARAERKMLLKEDLVQDPRTVTALVQKDQMARNRVLIELQRLTDLQDEDNQAPRLLGQRLLDLMRLP